jgi:hypothetical protein
LDKRGEPGLFLVVPPLLLLPVPPLPAAATVKQGQEPAERDASGETDHRLPPQIGNRPVKPQPPLARLIRAIPMPVTTPAFSPRAIDTKRTIDRSIDVVFAA